MLVVSDIYEDAQNIVGTCDDATLFRRLSEAVRMMAGKGDFDPLLGDMEICSYGGCLALPTEVDIVTAVNIDGHPITGRNRWFGYHANGPGDRNRWHACGWQYWRDGAQSPVIQDIAIPAKIVAFISQPEDAGKEVRVFGYDASGNLIRTKENNVWVDGYRVPTIFGNPLPETDAPVFARVTRVKKDVFVGWMRLSTVDGSDDTGALLGQYQYWETDPQYKRIILPRLCKQTNATPPVVLNPHLVRVSFRRRIFKIRTRDDVIPFDSSLVLMEALRAAKYYGDNDLASASGHEATAARLLTEEQNTRIPPIVAPIQISDHNMLVDKTDQMD